MTNRQAEQLTLISRALPGLCGRSIQYLLSLERRYRRAAERDCNGESPRYPRLEKARAIVGACGYSLYIQGDPRGCSVYVLRPGDIPEGCSEESYYTRGVAICL